MENGAASIFHYPFSVLRSLTYHTKPAAADRTPEITVRVCGEM